jgi:hypothetical protein
VALGAARYGVADDGIQRAIEAGRKNLRTMELVRNWCAHVKAVKHGGTGMVEMQTGLPIGHHFLECPHAPAGGMAAWDLAETAVDFYGRNCVGCGFRKPVGFPNISVLIEERDKKQRTAAQERLMREREAAEQLAAREEARRLIRAELTPLCATTLDQISEVDRTGDRDAARTLVEMSRLAPETLAPQIIEHLFDLIRSRVYPFVSSGLELLQTIGAEPSRLCAAALQALGAYDALEVAGQIVEATAGLADPSLIEAALPALIGLANPAPSRFGISGRPPRYITGPLHALYYSHPKAVRAGIAALLEKTAAEDVQYAARGIEALAGLDTSLAGHWARELVSKLARPHHLVRGPQEIVDDALRDIRSVLVLAFLQNPQEIDSLIGEYSLGARKADVAELIHLYDSVLREVRFDRGPTPHAITDAHQLAFKRMVESAVEAQTAEMENVTSAVFHGDPYALTPLAQEEITFLLGSAAVIATKLDELKANEPQQADEATWWDLRRHRSYLDTLLECFARWSCIAAGSAGVDEVNQILEFLRHLPESSQRLRAAIVSYFPHLMRSVDTLSACLPDYYSALVGPESIVRSCAATALGEMRSDVRDNLPSLVFEAFTALLTDRYVIVHKAAGRALDRFIVPEALNPAVSNALLNLIVTYAQSRDDDDFAMTCIDVLARRYVDRARLDSTAGSQLIQIMKLLRPLYVSRRVQFWGKLFANNPNYGGLLLHLMADEDTMQQYHEELLEKLARIPFSTLYAEREALANVAQCITPARRGLYDICNIIELLTSSGAWDEAARLSTSVFDAIEDTTRNRPLRLHAQLCKIACAVERAVEKGEFNTLRESRAEWETTVDAIEKDEEIYRERRDPLRGLRGKA